MRARRVEDERYDDSPMTKIAVIGMACRFPGASDTRGFWRNIRDGVESIRRYSEDELIAAGVDEITRNDPAYVPSVGALDGIELFDAKFFGMTPREAEITDPQHRLFLECAWEAMESAGYGDGIESRKTGVYAASGLSTYLLHNLLPNARALENADSVQILMANNKDYVPLRVSYKLNLRGPSYNLNTACSSSLVAIHVACQALLDYECDTALAGGVGIQVPQDRGYMYQIDGIVSPDGHCRAFDAKARGTVSGNGAGIVLLKRLDDAIADGDSIRAVILGSAVNNDGSAKAGFTAPSVTGQTEVILAALANAEVDPETIQYVEAHGTGTPVGDPIEIMALKEAYSAGRRRNGGSRTGNHIEASRLAGSHPDGNRLDANRGQDESRAKTCAIGSVKSNIGHLDEAAGVAGFIKTVLALEHRMIPPSLHFVEPNPEMQIEESGFHISAKLLSWDSVETPRRAGVSSFGLGGTNAHVILEEAPAPPSEQSSRMELRSTEPRNARHERPWSLLTLSARSETALADAAAGLKRHLTDTPGLNLKDVAYTLHVGRKTFANRRAILCAHLEQAVELLDSREDDFSFASSDENSNRPVVFLFPGQGSQYVGMGRELYAREEVFRHEVDRCSELFAPHLGFDIRKIIFPAAVDESDAVVQLCRTAITQPALFTIEYAMARLWMSWGVKPCAMMGHSIGEYVCACLASVISLEDVIALVASRGRMIQELPAGTMLAVNRSEEELRADLPAGVEIAALNEPSLTILSGESDAMRALEIELRERGIDARRVATSHAFHSAMMDPVLAAFEETVGSMKLNAPKIPYISNVTGTWMTPQDAVDPAYWSRHLRRTVRFSDGLAELMRDPSRVLLEVGPGRTLSSPALRHPARKSEQPAFAAMRTELSKGAAISDHAHVLMTLGKLWASGVAIDWNGFHKSEMRRRVNLPTYPFERKRFWIDPPDRGDPVPGARVSGALFTGEVAVDTPSAAARSGASLSSGGKIPIDEWFYIPSWKRSLPFASMPRVPRTEWVIYPDESGITNRCAEELKRTANVLEVTRSSDRARLPEQLRPASGSPISVLFMGNDFLDLLSISQDLAARDSDGDRLLVVTSGAIDVTGSESLSAEAATMLGIVKVLPQEFPRIIARAIDIDQAKESAGTTAALLVELQSLVEDRVIALRNGHRWIPAHEPVKLSEHTPARIRTRGVYLITGGLGGVGLILAEYLHKKWNARIVLISRTALPPRSDWSSILDEKSDAHSSRLHSSLRALLRLEEVGAEILIFQADVADEARMQEAFSRILDRFGELNGIIHAAGITTPEIVFNPIPETKPDHVAALFRPKIAGTIVLEKITRDLDLDFCALVSSNAATLGGIGFAAYSGASHFLDTFAARVRREGRPWISTNWDGWPDESGSVGGEFDMTIVEAPIAFARAISCDVAQVVISKGNLAARVHRWITMSGREKMGAVCHGATLMHEHPLEHSEAASDIAVTGTESERVIAGVWIEILGVKSIGARDRFFDLGGDSFLGTQVINRINKRMNAALSIRDLFDAPTVSGLTERIGTAQSRKIPRIPDATTYALSHAQRRLWIIHQMDPSNAAYNIPVHQLLEGPLDQGALDAALTRLAERHESLRTTFSLIEGEPRQIVHRTALSSLAFRDLSAHPNADTDARTRAQEHATQSFDLEAGPLFRAELLRIGPEKHLLLFTMHHIISDGVSLSVIARDLARLYAASPRLAQMQIQYRDFAAWQNELLTSDRIAIHRDYWLRKLGGDIEVLNFPADFPRPAIQTYRGRETIFEIPGELTSALKELGRRSDASLFMVIVAVVKSLLHRYTGQEDIVIGSPAAGRIHSDLEDQVGFYLNTLALRDTVTSLMSFQEILGEVRSTATEAYEHQIYPFDLLVDELRIERDLSRSPVFDVMVILQVEDSPDLAFEKIRVTSAIEHTGTSKLDLSFNFKTHNGGLLLGLEYNTDLFLAERIEYLGIHFKNLCREVIAKPATPIGRLDLLAPDERHKVIHAFNDTAVPYPRDRALIDFFEEQADITPSSSAAHHLDRTISYRDLDALANRIARHLHEACGMRAGDTAVIMLPPGFEMLASLLAVMKLRCGALFMDPSFPIARQEYLLSDSRSRVLITDSFPISLGFGGMTLTWDRDRDVIAGISAERIDYESMRTSDRNPDDTVLIFYTSGSTGKPKGVPLNNRGLVNEMHWYRGYFNFTAGDVMPQKTIGTFVDCIVELLLPITFGGGGCVYLRPHSQITGDFPALFEWFRSIGATILQFVPTIFEQLESEVDFNRLTTLRALVLSGGIVSRTTRTFAYPFRVYNLYGNSECTALSTYYDMTEPSLLRRIPIGKPLQNTTIYILDRNGDPCPIFVPGEMYIGGDMVSRTYLNNAELASTRFLKSPFREGEIIFRTGDHAQWHPDGNIDFLGRLDDQIKIRGFRIECGEIEHGLLQCDGIREAVVVGRKLDDRTQELVAYIVVESARKIAPSELRTHLAASLPDFMIPSFFVLLERFPLTPSGKIDKKALPAPSANATDSERTYVASRDAIEEGIARIWSEVLDAKKIGIHDDFLDLGGHSLKATRVVFRIRRELGLDVGLVDVFRSPTIAQLAAAARTRARVAEDRIAPLEETNELRSEHAPLTADEFDMLTEEGDRK